MNTTQVTQRIQHNRKIEGISAVLLPFDTHGRIDFEGLTQNIARTHRAGLTPSVNMDTGYTNLLSPQERTQVLQATRETLNGAPFVAGAFVEGQDGETLSLYQRNVAEIVAHGGTPILFQCSALKAMNEGEIIALYQRIGEDCERFLGFELGEMFIPWGQIYSLDVMRELMQIPQLVGAKHSSLNRELEWQRLQLRDEIRPDFKVYTGNDLAIDLVIYGSDYLLGLSAFCPEAFALRDRLWEAGDAGFYGLNDLIQYLGFFAFRPPVPAYKHTCAQFLKMRGRIQNDSPHPKAATRPDSDVAILQDISTRLDEMCDALQSRISKTA